MEDVIVAELAQKNILRSRELAKDIINKIHQKKFTLNFKGIEYVSKSFAHELMTIINQKKLEVKFKNMNENVGFIIKHALIKPKINIKIAKKAISLPL